MGEFRVWIALFLVVISCSASFAQEGEKASSTGRTKKQTTKPASFRKKKPTTNPVRFRRAVTVAPAKALSIKTVKVAKSTRLYVIVTLDKPVSSLWIYVHSADPDNKDVPTIRHAKRVKTEALRKAGITGLKGSLPRYLCPIPKADLKKLKGEALFSVTFDSAKQPRTEVSSCWYYHLATNKSTKVVEVPSEEPSSEPSTVSAGS